MYRVGIIGCGRPRETDGATGFGIAHYHAAGYKACEDTEIVAAILDLVDSLNTGREPELDGRKALRATESIFSAYESSRRRARIDLPLEITDSPFLDMLERGLIGPNRAQGS